MFINKQTRDAFHSWLSIGGGINYNSPDLERFYHFADVYCKYHENVTEKEFVKAAKQYTHTTISTNRGICQKFYRKLKTIQEYFSYKEKNNH